MDIKQGILTKRSVRTYTDEQLPKATVEELIRLGTKAATGSGLEPWGFAVLQDKDIIAELSSKTKAYVLENLESLPYLQQYRDWLTKPSFCVFNHAPTVLGIYGDPASHWYKYDCTLAAANIMLAAHSEGIGSCWIGFAEHTMNSLEFKQLMNIPEHYDLVCSMGLGYSKGNPPTNKRKEPKIFGWK